MSLTNNTAALSYQDMPMRAPRKKDLMVVSEMTSLKIVRYLAYRHRVGLLALCSAALFGYIAWDKVLHVFF